MYNTGYINNSFSLNKDFPVYYPNNHQKLILNRSSYGPQIAISQGMLTGNNFPNMYGPNLAPYPMSSSLQTGGQFSKKYNIIINPITSHKVNIKSKKGISILKNIIMTFT